MFSLLANWTTDMWAPVINLFSFIPNYAWSIIIFTIALKIVLSPLDFWQRKVQRDSTKKQQEMQPLVEKLQKQYANNKQVLNQKTMELYKKNNYNVVGSCVSMLVNFVLTLFIFFTLFYGLTGMAQNKIYDQYQKLETNFTTEYSTKFGTENTIDAVWANYLAKVDAEESNARAKLAEEGITEPTAEQVYAKQKELVQNSEDVQAILNNEASYYNTIKESWLWIDSIWRPDTYVSGFPDYNSYKSSSALTSRHEYKEVADSNITDEEKNAIFKKWEDQYNFITANIQKQHSSWNGYFILSILAALITYLSISYSQRTSLKRKKSQAQAPQQQGSMKIMKFLMPIIMVFFTLSYSAAFAIYIVTNQIMSFIISIIALSIFSRKDKDNGEIIVKPKKIDVEYSR